MYVCQCRIGIAIPEGYGHAWIRGYRSLEDIGMWMSSDNNDEVPIVAVPDTTHFA